MDTIDRRLIKKYWNKITGKPLNGDVKFYIDYPNSYDSSYEESEEDSFDIEKSKYYKYTKYSSKEELIKNIQELKGKLCFLKENNGNKEAKQIEKILEYIENPNNMYAKYGVDIIAIYFGEELVNLMKLDTQDDLLLPMIQYLRVSLAENYGYIIPNIRIMDTTIIKPTQYVILIRDKFVFKETLDINNLTKEEVTDLIINRLKELCFKYTHQILTKNSVLKLMELAKSSDPTLVNDLIPLLISAIDLKNILANLLKEKISIVDILYIFELLNHHAQHTQDVNKLTKLLKKDLNFK